MRPVVVRLACNDRRRPLSCGVHIANVNARVEQVENQAKPSDRTEDDARDGAGGEGGVQRAVGGGDRVGGSLS